MDRAVAFYRDVLGLTPGYTSPYWSDFDLGAFKIGLHPGAKQPAQAGSGWYLGLATNDLKALRDSVEASSGSVVEDYHQTPSGVVLTIADPDGNPVQLMQPGSKLAEFS